MLIEPLSLFNSPRIPLSNVVFPPGNHEIIYVKISTVLLPTRPRISTRLPRVTVKSISFNDIL